MTDFVTIIVLVLLVAGGGVWYWYRRRDDRLRDTFSDSTFEPLNRLDECLVSWRKRNGSRDAFYRAFLRYDLYVFGRGNQEDEFVELDSDTELNLEQWRYSDRWYVPVFTSLQHLQDSISGEKPYVQIYARDLLLVLDEEESVILNPGTSVATPLSSDTLQGLLDGSSFREMSSFRTRDGTEGWIGPSEEHPPSLEDTLRTLFSGNATIEYAFIAQIYVPSTEQPPHPVIGVKGSGDLLSIMAEAEVQAQKALPEGQYVDFRRVDGDDPISTYMRENLTPFFE